jgi:hypothetical protein
MVGASPCPDLGNRGEALCTLTRSLGEESASFQCLPTNSVLRSERKYSATPCVTRLFSLFLRGPVFQDLCNLRKNT